MFDDNNVASFKLNFGARVLADSLICGRFISVKSQSVAAISHTLDKVVILDTAAKSKTDEDFIHQEDSLSSIEESRAVVHVAIRDVIKSIGVVTSRWQQKQDVLLIGCPNSVIIYNVHNQTHLLSIRTSSSIECILVSAQSVHQLSGAIHGGDDESSSFTLTNLAICAGAQKLYTIKLGDGDSNWEDSELTSERSTSGSTISCLTRAGINSHDLLLTGSSNCETSGGLICLYQLNLSDQTNNVQACRLRIDESAPITCLCAIPTAVQQQTATSLKRAEGDSLMSSSGTLPNLAAEQQQATNRESLHYFAYGLQNGLLGVYRLIETAGAAAAASSIGHERLWRHKCKCTPISIELFDMNGDGHDELVIAFASGRLELRSPFTGQLLAATRLTSAPANTPISSNMAGLKRAMDRAQVGLAQGQVMGNLWLLAGTARGTIIGFRPLTCKPRQVSQDYSSTTTTTTNGSVTVAADSRHFGLAGADEIDLSGGEQTIGDQPQDAQLADHKKTLDLHMPAVESSTPTDLLAEPTASGGKGSCAIEARQSYDLLQKINSLYARQIELKQRVSRLLVCPATVGQASKYTSAATCLSAAAAAAASTSEANNQVSIRHRWDLDLARLELRLTIEADAPATQPTIGGSQMAEAFKLVQVEEEKRILIESGRRLLSIESTTGTGRTKQVNAMHSGSNVASRDATFVSRLNFNVARQLNNSGTQFEPTSLKVKLFHQKQSSLALSSSSLSSLEGDTRLGSQNRLGEGKICQKHIDVPKFAMFTFAHADDGGRTLISPDATAKSGQIRLSYRLDDRSQFEQIFDWLEENFLCLQVQPSLIADENDDEKLGGCHISDMKSYIKERSRFISSSGDSSSFQLNLLDAKQTLLKRNNKTTLGLHSGEAREQPDGRRKSSAGQEQQQQQQYQLGEYSLLLIALFSRSSASSSSSNFEPPLNRLELECESVDLAVHLVQSLVIDRLRLDPSSCSIPKLAAALRSTSSSSFVDNLVACCRLQLATSSSASSDNQTSRTNVRPILEELVEAHKRLSEQEESESRILTELYESADYTKNLLQQLSIAIELNEFSTARELLGELFMMLDGTQNAARGHSLNNRSRQELSSKFNQIREKLSLITLGRRQL